MTLAQARTSKIKNLFRGRQDDKVWVRPALVALLLLTAVAYIWGLNQSGWANSFYSAAVQAASKSWKAFFFGSIDASNFITVDKPPASLWVMDLSVRIFGVNSWSILIPEALEGVACVWILYAAIRRWFNAGAALLGATALAITPVAALMFRFNNPDALLVLLLTSGAYALTRALEKGRWKWILFSAVLIGLGFLTKMLAAFIVIPGFVLVYLLFAPVSLGKRIAQVAASAIAVVVSAGWWVAIVQLTPASQRPYIGSSQDNSILNLIFGYNGLGRLSSNSGMGAGFSGATGPFRLFAADMGGQISWLIPAALILSAVAVGLLRQHWRTDKAVQAISLWFTTFLVTAIVFSFGQGIIHTYYTIALAPSIAALVGIGSHVLWQRREQLPARLGLAAATLASAIWAFVLLDRSPQWYPWLRFFIIIVAVIASFTMVFGSKLNKRLFVGAGAAAVISSLAGPLAYTVDTVTTSHTGSTPSAGPSVSTTTFGGRRGGRFAGGFGGGQPTGNGGERPSGGTFGGGTPPEGGGYGSPNFAAGNGQGASSKTQSSGFPGGATTATVGNKGFRGAGGGFGGRGNSTPSTAVVKLLQTNASKYTWVLATGSSMSSAPYQLATGDAVMAMGGFSGSDNAITLTQFKQDVSEGKIHYYLADGMGFGASKNNQPGGAGRSNSISSITNWVENNFKTVTVSGVTFYDLSQPKS